MQTKLDESEKKIELMVTVVQTLIKKAPKEKGEEPHSEAKDDNKKEEKGEKSTPQADPRVDWIEQLLQESFMFNNYLNDCAGFTSIHKGKLGPKSIMSDIKFNGTKNPHYHVRNFLSTMTLKRINKDIFHIIFPWTFDKDLMN